MTRYLIIAAALLSLPSLTDWMVDHHSAHEAVGYTRQERDAMSRLVERSVAPKYRWSNHRAAQLASIWGITPQELDGPMDIFGEGKRK